MKISVIIPTYKRVEDLKRCLSALKNQDRPADEVFVICHVGDEATLSRQTEFFNILNVVQFLKVERTSQVAAMNLALKEASGDIICFTDDDSAPHPNWLYNIEKSFLEDPELGGLGGRDIVMGVEDKSTDIVGVITFFGRIIGRHNLIVSSKREVDHLKGVNMSYRKQAIEGQFFDSRLLGKAECKNDMAFSLAVKRKGWKVVYDPEVQVDHYVSFRADDTQRGSFNAETIHDEAFNETLVLLSNLPFRKKLISLLWAFLCGNVAMPGPVQFLRKTMYSRKELWQRFLVTMKGRVKAIKVYL